MPRTKPTQTERLEIQLAIEKAKLAKLQSELPPRLRPMSAIRIYVRPPPKSGIGFMCAYANWSMNCSPKPNKKNMIGICLWCSSHPGEILVQRFNAK